MEPCVCASSTWKTSSNYLNSRVHFINFSMSIWLDQGTNKTVNKELSGPHRAASKLPTSQKQQMGQLNSALFYILPFFKRFCTKHKGWDPPSLGNFPTTWYLGFSIQTIFNQHHSLTFRWNMMICCRVSVLDDVNWTREPLVLTCNMLLWYVTERLQIYNYILWESDYLLLVMTEFSIIKCWNWYVKCLKLLIFIQ